MPVVVNQLLVQTALTIAPEIGPVLVSAKPAEVSKTIQNTFEISSQQWLGLELAYASFEIAGLSIWEQLPKNIAHFHQVQDRFDVHLASLHELIGEEWMNEMPDAVYGAYYLFALAGERADADATIFTQNVKAVIDRGQFKKL